MYRKGFLKSFLEEHVLCFLTTPTKLAEQDLVEKEMITMPISAPLKMALVASPDYLAQHGLPKNIDDLQQHRLIGAKLSAEYGAEMQWEFKDKKELITFEPKSRYP